MVSLSSSRKQAEAPEDLPHPASSWVPGSPRPGPQATAHLQGHFPAPQAGPEPDQHRAPCLQSFPKTDTVSHGESAQAQGRDQQARAPVGHLSRKRRVSCPLTLSHLYSQEPPSGTPNFPTLKVQPCTSSSAFWSLNPTVPFCPAAWRKNQGGLGRRGLTEGHAHCPFRPLHPCQPSRPTPAQRCPEIQAHS